MAEAIGTREFLYTPIKTPFVWYPITGRYKVNRVLNGKFDTSLDNWTVDFGWVWASDGTAHAQLDCVMRQSLNNTQTQENIRLRVTLKEIVGANALLVITIRNTITAAFQQWTVGPGGEGIYDFFGVGDEIEFGTSAATTDIKIDDVEIYDGNYKALLYENRPYCKDECPYKLLTPSTAFLPFILVRPSSATSLTSIVCVHDDGTTISFDATEIAAIAAFRMGTYSDAAGVEYDYIIYNGATHGKYFKCGYWRGVAEDGAGNVWAAEPFFIGNYGYGGRNLLGNGGFDLGSLGSWTVAGGWTWENGTARLSGVSGSLQQDFAFNAPLRVKIKVIDMPGASQTVTLRISQTGGGAPTTDLIITTPGKYTLEGTGGRVLLSVVGAATGIIVDDFEAYALNGDPNVCHTKLHWYNTCDLFNVPYSKGFLNILYLEKRALTAAPEWKEETEVVKDGVGRERQTAYRKWKEYLLDTGAIPEYIYDSLGLLNVHNLKFLSLPSESVQENIIIRNSALKNSWLTGECYTNTELALIIEEVFDTQCCDEDWKRCLTACFDVVGFKEDYPSPAPNTYYINHSDDKVELWNGQSYEEVDCESGMVKNLETGRFMYHYTLGAPYTSDWYVVPHLLAVTDLTENRYRLDAVIPPAGCRSNIWVKDGAAGTWTIISNLDPPAQSCAIAGVNCKTIVFVPTTTDVYFRIDGFTHNFGCPTFGFSNEVCVGAGCPI